MGSILKFTRIKLNSLGCSLPDTCGFGIGPPDCPHRATEGRGENLSFMAKIPNGEFYLCF